jgi:hypothetical protein
MLTTLLLSCVIAVLGEQIHWGETFGGPESANVEYKCEFNGLPICCGLLDGYGKNSEGSGVNEDPPRHVHCKVSRVYEPSKYEERHYNLAVELITLPTSDERRERQIDLMIADIPDANKWLERVQQYMKLPHSPPKSSVDEEFLSKFQVNETCRFPKPDGTFDITTTSFTEHIEPLVLAARHPFAHTGCKRHEAPIARFQTHMDKMAFRTQAQGVDYVLLQSAEHTHAASRHGHGHGRSSARSYLLDAGTSSFESSLKWFYCAYLQVRVRSKCNK